MLDNKSPVRVYRVADLVPNLKKELLSRSSTPDLPLASLPQLSERMHGIHRKKLTLISARPSHGKSAFALQLARDLALQNKSVLYISLEMSNVSVVERIFCGQFDIENSGLLRGRGAECIDALKAFEESMRQRRFAVTDSIGWDWNQISEYLNQLHTQPDVIIVDYLNAIRNVGQMEKGVLDEYIRAFRESAVRNNFAAILCSQVNRSNQETASKDKAPKLHQLKGTGVLEEHADVIFLLWWPYKNGDEDINKFQLELAKNRNGPTGYYQLKFFPEYYSFRETTYYEDLSGYENPDKYNNTIKDLNNGLSAD